tara:strand:- start:71156 stop:71830 length:675 start_codon:yes stop_codon:yes gene_type:complete
MEVNCDCNTSQDKICQQCGTHLESSGKTYINSQSYNNQSGSLKLTKPLAELDSFMISEEVKLDITNFYHDACGSKVKRNAPRRALIYWSIIDICKRNDIIFDSKELQTKLNIKQSDINKAVKTLRGFDINTEPGIGVVDIMRLEIERFDIKTTALSPMKEIYDRCKRVCPEFNSCKLETLVSGILHYYLEKNLPGFNEVDFFSRSPVSQSAILRIHATISGIYD